MSLSLAELKEVAATTLGNEPREDLSPERIVNEAGKYLYAMHPWQWRNRPAVPLSFIAPISISDGTWTQSSLTLTKTSGFTNYTFRGAELIEITDGTSATDGYYRIASRTSANAIVLANTIGSSADGSTDIDGTINFPYCVLPSDFGTNGEVVSVTGDNGNRYAQPGALSTVRHLRFNSSLSSCWLLYALSYPTQTATSEVPADPLLELSWSPTAADPSPLLLTYRSGWVNLTSEDALANIPADYDHLLQRLVKAFAKEAQLDNELDIVAARNSQLTLDLMKRDGGQQSNLGPIEGGAARRYARGYSGYAYNPYTITGP